MYLISVTPFSKTIKMNTLTYFSSKDIQPGLIVSIPLRNKTVKGLVLSSKNIRDSKQEIKSASYGLKKIKGISQNPLLNREFIKAAERTADFFISSPGAIINSLVPKNILDDINKFQFPKDKIKNTEENPQHRKYILQSPNEERYSDYKSLIRSQFVKNGSIFFCVPTNEDVHYAEEFLSKGIESNTFSFHSKMSKKNLECKWNEIINRKKPSLIIATGNFLSLPINNLGTIIIERESSGAYKTMSRPFFDLRYFAEILAHERGATLILGDTLLRAETLWRYDQNEFIEYTPIKFRSLSSNDGKIIDLTQEKILHRNEDTKEKKYPIISDQAKDILIKAHKKNERSFLFVSKKGLSPIIICGDCGKIVTCENCSAPIVLYGKNATEKENFFKCHSCGKNRHAGETCKKCGSWKLIELGVGTEKVQKIVCEFINKNEVFVLDKNTAKTPLQARNIVKKFLEHPGGILIGTEMALLYLHEVVEQGIIISIDSMFSIPDFQIKERILNILLYVRNIASQNFIIQTRDPKNQIFTAAIRGDLANFYREEFVERKKLNYPPFSIIIKISVASTDKNKLTQNFEALKKYFAPLEFNYFPAMIERVKGKYIMNGIIKMKKENWIDTNLANKLETLPPQYKIEVDSQSII